MGAFSFKEYFGPSFGGSASDNDASHGEMDRENLEGRMEESTGDGQSSQSEAPPVLSFDAEPSPAVEHEAEDDDVYNQLTSLFDAGQESEDSSGEASPDEEVDSPAPAEEASDENRLGWLMDFVQNEVEEADQEEEPASEGGTSEEEEETEVLWAASEEAVEQEDAASESLAGEEDGDQDEVVATLLRREAVVMEQVAQANVLCRERAAAEEEEQLSVWRALAEVEGVDRQVVYEEAARVHGFSEAGITEEKPTTVFLHTVLNVFPLTIRKRLIELHLLPYKFAMDEEAMQQCLIVATHDPTHPDVQAFVQELGLQVDLRYTPEVLVRQRIASVQRLAEATGEFGEEEESSPVAEEPVEASPAESQAALEDSTPVASSPSEEGPDTDGGSSTAIEEPAPEGLRLVEKPSPTLPALHAKEPAPVKAGDDQDTLVTELAEQNHPDLDPRLDSADPRFGESLALEAVQVQNNIGLNTPVENNVTVENTVVEAPPSTVEESEAPGADQEFTQAPAEEVVKEAPADPAGKEDKEDVVEEGHAEAVEAIKSEDRVVAMLLRDRIVTSGLVLKARAYQEQTGSEEALWRILAGTDGTDREAIFAAAARLYGFSGADLEEHSVNPDFARSIIGRFGDKQQDQLLELSVMPYESGVDGQTGAIRLAFITHDPTRPKVHRVMHKLDIERFELKYAPESVVSDLIAEAFPKKNEYLERMEDEAGAVDLGMSHDDDGELIDEDALEAEMSRSKLINLFEATLVEGVREGASDIHIYPNANKKVEIHFRVDGRLKHWHTEEKVHPEALLAVIKDNAMNVDRFERDAAQDGFIQRKIDNALIRFRVSVLPIANASQEIRSESIVIRILDDRKVITNLNKLGLLDSALDRFNKAIRQPHGMVILTGPTGSGKSTTLVAALHQVVTPEVNVLTVEDPVEYIINGVRQIKLNNKLTLDGALRSILRHDPDIVMVGEMRDRHTAELAIKLANTGHLTFSTLHTNDAPSAISRLYKMGIEPFLIAYAINLVVAQRLIRRLCPNCKHADPDPDPVLLEQLGFSEEEVANTTFYLPGDDRSCPSCGGLGYKGRRAISEALYFSRKIRHMIVEAEDMIDEGTIREQARKEGMLTLKDSAREVVRLGDTSVREMIRVVSSE